jgi:DNA-binding NtrC family response regulator
MNPENPGTVVNKDTLATYSSVEDIIEKKLEDIATVLCTAVEGKSKLHEEVVSMVERSLFRIALKRSNNVKSAAATYLGINRNTFQNKMVKLGIHCEASRQGKQ